MIQRIQSILLLLACGATLGLLKLPLIGSIPSTQSQLLADGALALNDHLGLIIAFAGAAVLTLLAIFLFRNRPLQMRVNLLSILFILAGAGRAVYLLMSQTEAALDQLRIGVGTFLPLAGIILILMANRNIKKDEKLVQSLDRLR